MHLQHWDRAAREIAEEQSGLLQTTVDELLGGSDLQGADGEPNTAPLASAETVLSGTPIGEARLAEDRRGRRDIQGEELTRGLRHDPQHIPLLECRSRFSRRSGRFVELQVGKMARANIPSSVIGNSPKLVFLIISLVVVRRLVGPRA